MEKSCDGGVCHGREDFDAQVSIRDLLDSYLVPFQACVERGKSIGLMCSYSKSILCTHCHNVDLLIRMHQMPSMDIQHVHGHGY